MAMALQRRIRLEGVTITYDSTPYDIPDGDYWVTEADGEEDELTYVIDDLIGIYVTVLRTGVGRIVTGSTAALDLGSDELAAALGFSSKTMSGATTYDGDRSPKGSVYTDRVAVVDAPVERAAKSVSVATSGLVDTVAAAPLVLHRLGLMWRGGPRAAVEDEYAQLLDWWRLSVAQGAAFRLVPDTDYYDSPYDKYTAPYGYHELVVSEGPDWDPWRHALQPGWLEWYQTELLCRELVT